MVDIQKKIIRDDSGAPVAVQVSYEDWLRLEGYLAAVADDDASGPEAAGAASGTGDSTPHADLPGFGSATGRDAARQAEELHFQQRLLEEWAELDADETAEDSSSSPSSLGPAIDAARGTLSEASDERSLTDLYAEWDRALR